MKNNHYLLLATHVLFCIPAQASKIIQSSHECINFDRSWFDTEIKKLEAEFITLCIPKMGTNMPSTQQYINVCERILAQRSNNLSDQQRIIDKAKDNHLLTHYEINSFQEDIESKKICDCALVKSIALLMPKKIE
ncbi:MAG: hypothetical protein P4L31_02755 [Candidatus Babeliales bacterium]|nr:hypothetical protein [Candidatus Babeliales bacterium]